MHWRGDAEQSVRRSAPTQVSLDQKLGATAEADAIDLQVLEHALHIVARLRERDALDPIDRIDVGIARIAETLDPVAHAATARIVAGERQDIRAAVIRDQVAKLGRAELN